MATENGYGAMTIEQRLERIEAQMDRLDIFGRPAVGAIEQLEHRLNSSFAQIVFDMRNEIDAIKELVGK